MLLSSLGLLLTVTGAVVSGQSCSHNALPASESDVPHGVAIPGNYDCPLRPQIHYSPPLGFMNDPNGLFVDGNGLWHLYYQCTDD